MFSVLIRITFQWVHTTYEPVHDKTNKMTCAPAKTQIRLGIHPVWSESSLCIQWVAKYPSFLHADSEDSDQTGQMPRLIWVFAERTSFCWFFRLRLICFHGKVWKLSLNYHQIPTLSVSLVTVTNDSHWSMFGWEISHPMLKPTKWQCTSKDSVGIHPVWLESWLCIQWVAKYPSFLHVESEDSDQTGQMPRLIRVFAGHTCYFVGFDMRQLKCQWNQLSWSVERPIPTTQMSRKMTKPAKWLCAQQLRSAWVSAQSDQSSLSAWRKFGSLANH